MTTQAVEYAAKLAAFVERSQATLLEMASRHVGFPVVSAEWTEHPGEVMFAITSANGRVLSGRAPHKIDALGAIEKQIT